MAERRGADDGRRKTALAALLAAERSTRAAARQADHWTVTLRRAAASAVTRPSLDTVLAQALRAIADALAADAAAVLIASEEGDELTARASVGLAEEIEVELRIRAGAGVAGRVLASNEPLIVDDLSQVEVASETLRRSGVLSWAGVPLRSDGRVLGVLHVTSKTPAYFSDEDIEVLEVLADPIASAIERVQLFEAERAARLTAELAVQRLRSLQRMTAALASARSADEVYEVILREALVGAEEGAGAERAIWMLRDGHLILVAGGEQSRQYPEIPLDSTLPAFENLQEGTPLFVETRAEVTARWPVLQSSATAAFAAFPLIVADRKMGVMAIGYRADHVFDETERAYLGATAEQAALALDRAIATAYEESVRGRRDFLAEASIVISDPSRDPGRVLARLADFVVPQLADACVVMLARGERLEVAASAPAGSLSEEVGRLAAELPIATATHGPMAVAMKTGLPAFVEHAEAATDLGSTYGPFVARLGMTSAMLVPLMVHGRPTGVMLFAAGRDRRRYEREDLELAMDLGARAAAAAEDLATRTRERTFTEMLTRALLPSRFPVVSELEFAARYVPADLGPVGGDWYDVFELPEGKIGLVIGDVAGHGIEAASTMARLRNGLFAYATEGHGATAIFDRLSGLLAGPSGDWQVQDPIATVMYAIYDRSSGQIVTSCAGHPPWLRLHSDKAEYVPCGGRLLAPGIETMCEEHIVALEREDTLLFFTDGLVERPGEPLETGLDRLADAVSHAGHMRLEAICDLALRATAPAFGRHDDCCLLAVRVL